MSAFAAFLSRGSCGGAFFGNFTSMRTLRPAMPGYHLLLSRCIHHDPRYRDSRILASGWLLGEAVIAKRSALVDAKIGQGHAILFGMRPQYRLPDLQIVL